MRTEKYFKLAAVVYTLHTVTSSCEKVKANGRLRRKVSRVRRRKGVASERAGAAWPEWRHDVSSIACISFLRCNSSVNLQLATCQLSLQFKSRSVVFPAATARPFPLLNRRWQQRRLFQASIHFAASVHTVISFRPSWRNLCTGLRKLKFKYNCS